jgi:hypothetical protein
VEERGGNLEYPRRSKRADESNEYMSDLPQTLLGYQQLLEGESLASFFDVRGKNQFLSTSEHFDGTYPWWYWRLLAHCKDMGIATVFLAQLNTEDRTLITILKTNHG